MALKLPKLGETGKDIAIGTAVAGALTFGGLVIAKKAENKRISQSEADYLKKYPFSNFCNEMKDTLQKAQLELAQIKASSTSTSGAKRIKERNTNALAKRIAEIEQYLPSLDCSAQSIPENVVNDVVNAPKSQLAKYAIYGGIAIVGLLVVSRLFKNN